MCGILLVADALVDLIVVTKVPQINEILAAADAARFRSRAPVRLSPLMARLATLYSEIWTLLAASRFCLFFAVSFFIYQSKPGAWGVKAGNNVSGYNTGGAADEAISGLDQLKNRVVFTYGFLEAMFWSWVSYSLWRVFDWSSLLRLVSCFADANTKLSYMADSSHAPGRAARGSCSFCSAQRYTR